MISFRPNRRARVPSVIQQEAQECGAACLSMILAAHGQWVPLEELRDLCGVSRDGAKAVNLLRVARQRGMIAKGVRKEIDELPSVPAPFVVFWNFNHFVVVEQVRIRKSGEGFAWINDPSSGPRKVEFEELNKSFTGVVLTFAPLPQFERVGRRTGILRLLAMILSGHGLGMFHVVLAGLMLIVPVILMTGLTRVFLDYVVVDQARSWLWPLIGLLSAFALLRAVLMYLQQIALLRTQTVLSISQAARQMWMVLNLHLNFFGQRFSGDIAHRFIVLDRLGGVVANGVAPAAIACVALVGYGLALFALEQRMALVLAVSAAIALLLLVLSARGLQDLARRTINDEGKLQAATIQGAFAADDFKASGTESLFLARWMGCLAKVVDAEQKGRQRSLLLNSASGMLMALAGVGVIVIGGFDVIAGISTIGAVLAFQTLLPSFTSSLFSFVGLSAQLQQVRGISERLEDVARYRKIGSATLADQYAGDRARGLELRQVSFGYARLEPPFIRELSLNVAPGARIGIVGGSGSGKSTVGRLLAGLLDPIEGEVLCEGIALNGWRPARLRQKLSYVEQDTGLFEGSVRDNITLWDPTISEARIVAAARDAGAHDFITSKPGGYQAHLTESGGNLSGGERQRLAIARSLVVEPEVVICDEATSALDPPVEKSIMDAIRRRGCGCIIIAHRLSTIRDCDLIIVLEAGRVADHGSHQDLLERSPLYRSLIET